MGLRVEDEASIKAKEEKRARQQKGLKVRAVRAGEYPVGVMRQPGDVFLLSSEKHFSDSRGKRKVSRVDGGGNRVTEEMGYEGWMEKVS